MSKKKKKKKKDEEKKCKREEASRIHEGGKDLDRESMAFEVRERGRLSERMQNLLQGELYWAAAVTPALDSDFRLDAQRDVRSTPSGQNTAA